MYKVLVVDDEESIVKGLEMNLFREGYQVIKATDGETAVKLACRENPDVVLLDVMMPGMSGLDVCRELRKRDLDTRIIMVSARGEEIDRVVGLEVGADDYIAKPFSMRELLALMHARLRYRGPGPAEKVSAFLFGDVEVNFDHCRATKNEAPVKMTQREFGVLQFLIQHRGQAVSREQILGKVWGADVFTTIRTVDNHILRLRRKLEPNPGNPQFILSVYGGGYKFVG